MPVAFEQSVARIAPGARRSGGQIVVDALRRHGVREVFCVPGESYLPVLDALYDAANEIRLYTCRHESGAGLMAEAAAKLTGRPGVALVTRGPGACNASIAVHVAMHDSTPLVLLVGQVVRPFLGRDASQEVDFERMFAPLAKWVRQVDRVDDLPGAMAEAFRIATSARPGPVVLALPADMLREETAAAYGAPLPADPPPPSADVDRLLAALEGASRPLVIVGGGVWSDRAKARLRAFAEASDLPVVCSFRRHDIFDNTHYCFAGEMGNDLNPEFEETIRSADVLLAIGTRMSSSPTRNYTRIESPRPRQRLFHVYPDRAEIGRVFEAELGIVATPDGFVEMLSERAPLDGARWQAWRAEARARYERSLEPRRFGVRLELGDVMLWLRRRLPGDAIVTVDAGNFSDWAQRFLTVGAGQRLLGPAVGAMGYAVPAAVAASLLHPRRMTVAFVGDGGFGMTGQELATAAQYGAAPIVLVFNNNMLGTIRAHQERSYPGRTIGTDLVNPDYAAIARAHGGHGEVVERTADFAPAFERAAASGKPSVVELRLDASAVTTRLTLDELRAEAATALAAARRPGA
jgi:acetolactate synthase-1/2/3 large subunit